MAEPGALCYTDISSKRTKTETEEKTMKNTMKDMMKGIALGILSVALVIAGQMALTGVAGFRTAELAGGAAVAFLFYYTLFRSVRKRREAKAEKHG